MTQKTDLDVSPFWDDYNKNNDFYKVLFRPGHSVQARELTTLQSILQNQIEQFGNHMFKEGTIVIPGSISYNERYDSLKIQETFGNNDVSTYLDQYVGSTITGSTSGVTARVVGYDTFVSGGDPNTLYVKYIKSSSVDNSTKTFTDGEGISSDVAISSYAANVYSATTYDTGSTNTGSSVSVTEGVFFVRGYFVQNTEQVIVLDKYTNTSSCRVGWKITESIVSPEEDSSLLDNSQGSSNYAASGAHRLKITLTLTKKDLNSTDDADFIELCRIESGNLVKKMKATEYSVIADMIARRTDDESGDYIVKHFNVEPREHLNDGLNRGIYSSSNGGDETKGVLSIAPGKAYVNGYEVETQNTTFAAFDKARTTKTLLEEYMPIDLGTYVEVTNVFGQPDVTKDGSALDPFDIVDLYDTATIIPGNSSGALVGKARSRGFEFKELGIGGVVGDYTSVYKHFLFDITMFNTIDVTVANTLSQNAVITGTTSGATGIVVASIAGGGQFQVMQQSGNFVVGESFTSSVSTDTVAGTILSFDNKTFSSDVKQIHTSVYSSDLLTNASFTLSGDVTEAGGGITIQGQNTAFLEELIVGDVVSFPSGPGGLSEERIVTQIIDNTTFDIDFPLTSFITSTSAVRKRTKIQGAEQGVLVYSLPKDNVQTLLDGAGVNKTSYYYRRQFGNVTSSPTGVCTFTAGVGEEFGSFSDRDYTLVITSAGSGTGSAGEIVPLSTKVAGEGTNTFTVTDNVILGNGAIVTLMATIRTELKLQKTKTAQKMTTKTVDTTTYPDIYGERFTDKEISLSYADVYKVHSIYESIDGSGGSVPTLPTLTIAGATGSFTVGEVIRGSVSGAMGRVILDSNPSLTFVIINGTFNALDTISGDTSTNTATISNVNLGDKNVTSSYLLDTGERDGFYDIGRVVKKNTAPTPTGQLTIVYDYFSHGTGDFFTVDSYTGQVDYDEIPYYETKLLDPLASKRQQPYPLSDCLDFRPRVKDQTVPTSTPFAFTNKDFESTGSSYGNLVKPGSSFNFDFKFYLPRKDLVYLDRLGVFEVVKGVPAEEPEYPAEDNISMIVGRMNIPAYTYKTDDVLFKYEYNKGYTMKAIGKLEKRISNLEYSTSLGLLEKETQSFEILDADGLNRFKSGFIVDNFYGHSIGHTHHPDYQCSVDPVQGNLRPSSRQGMVELIEENVTDDQRTADHYTRSGDIITLPYTDVEHQSQPYGSRVESVNPFSVTQWIGNMTLTPESDIWMDDEQMPSITVNVEGNYEQMLREGTSSGALGTVWGSWNTTWTGNARSSSSSSVQDRRSTGVSHDDGWIRRVSTTTTSVDVRQRRTGVNTRLVERVDNQSLGNRVMNIEVMPWMRSRDVEFNVTGMKPNTRVYAFFNGVDVNNNVLPTSANKFETTLSSNLLKTETTISVTDTSGFGNSGSLLIGDPTEIDPWGVGGFIPLETITYTGKTTTTLTGVTRNSDFRLPEPGQWLSGTPITNSIAGGELITDGVGQLSGIFKIPNTPEKRFRVGRATLRLTDSPTDSKVKGFVETSSEKEYMAIGHQQTKQEAILAVRNGELRQRTVSSERSFTSTSRSTADSGWYDPLAQTIQYGEEGGIFATKVDIFFSHKDTEMPVWIEVRTVENGYPSQTILPFSKVIKEPGDVVVDPDLGITPTTFTFSSPLYLKQDTEYAIVVASETANYKIWISRLGEIDVGGNRAISTQPTLGSLFKSQNASTWTASQYEDLKFTLYRAEFDTTNTGSFTVVNEELTELSGHIPTLKENPIESQSGLSTLKINLQNHGMYSTSNNVKISGVISDISPTALNGAITSGATTITCDSISNFPTAGTIKIDNELITYTGKSGSTILTGCTRGTVDGAGNSTTAASHLDNSVVDLYMFAGIPLIEVNKTHTSISGMELDSFLISTTTPSTTTTTGGGSNVKSTKNIVADVMQPMIQTMELTGTSVTGQMRTTSGRSVSSTTQTSFVKTPLASSYDAPLNEDYYHDAPTIVCSQINETNELAGEKSFIYTLELSSNNKNISPVVDLQRSGLICVGNRLDKIDSASNIGAMSTFNDSTTSSGDSNNSIYITKKVTLKNPGTAIRVMFDADVSSNSNIKVLYKIQKVDAQDESFEDLDWVYFNTDGSADKVVPSAAWRDDFREHKYTAGKNPELATTTNALEEFIAFSIKIVMQGTNTSRPVKIKDFRAIALQS